eukprot:1195163-Prorocentrum_minimum.AAC.2
MKGVLKGIKTKKALAFAVSATNQIASLRVYKPTDSGVPGPSSPARCLHRSPPARQARLLSAVLAPQPTRPQGIRVLLFYGILRLQ